jgi:hypothetical protein
MAKSRDPQTVVAESRRGLTSEVLQFPYDDTIDNNFTIISFTEYTRINPFQKPDFHHPLCNIILPLPYNGLQDVNALKFGDQTLGALGGLGATLAGRGGNAGQAAAGATVAAGLATAESAVAVGDALLDKYTGMKSGVDAGVVGLAAGAVVNPNLAVAFEGVEIRDHTFSWRMIAKNQYESQLIYQIIQRFKSFALPSKTFGSAYALNYPKIVNILFQPALVTMSDLGLFITDISVSYDGDGHPAFYKDTGAPVVVDLQVRFKERAILTSEDYKEYPSQNSFLGS